MLCISNLKVGTKSLAKASYIISLLELAKQLDELLEANFIRPSKAPYDALVLFQRKQGV